MLKYKGGYSMQYKAPRFRYRLTESVDSPDLTEEPECVGPYGPGLIKEAKRLPGKIHRGVPPRNSTTTVTTIPEKGAEGYLITEDGPIKIYNPPEDRPIGPSTYYNPEEKENYTTFQYKGHFWSLRTARRFKCKTVEGPSPAEYSVGQEHVSPWKQYQEFLQSMNKANAPSLRYDDMLLRKLQREDLPGPEAYSPKDPKTTKCDCGIEGTFSKAERESLYGTTEGPGPAAYVDPRTALERASRTISQKQSPFNVDAQRFPLSKTISPGPSDYVPQVGLWNNVQKKGHSRYSQWSASFDSSAYRNTVMTKPDALYTPGPDEYYPQKKGDQKQSSGFASKVTRDSKITQSSPGPAFYSALEGFKIISSHKSHFKPKDSSFLTSSKRLEPLRRSCSPGPFTYDTAKSSLGEKSGIIGMKFPKKAIEITPSPAHYKIHPKLANPRVLQTYNVTLKKETKPKAGKKKKVSCVQRKETVKKLRCFSAICPARHCITTH